MSEPSERWLPLLRRLGDEVPSWGVWKNVDRALAGSGDVDSAAPRRDWPAITSAFTSWAGEHGLGPVISCTHPPHALFLLAVDTPRATFEELDVLARKYFRGSTLFHAEDLIPLYEIDERGFRRVRAGAEGLILLLQNGTKWGGRPDPAGLAKRPIAELVSRDPEGVREAARAFRLPPEAAADATDAVAGDDWDRRAVLALERASIRKALAEPGIIARRAWFRGVSKRACPVLASIFRADRRIDGDVGAWVAGVRASHPVIEVTHAG